VKTTLRRRLDARAACWCRGGCRVAAKLIQVMGTVMAGKGSDFQAHERTYSGFIALFKWGALASFILAFIVILLIAR